MRMPFTVYVLASLSLGLVMGYAGFSLPGYVMHYALVSLIFVAGLAIGREFKELVRQAGRLTYLGVMFAAANIVAGCISGLLISRVLGGSLRVGSVIGAGSGWYTLVGPLVSQVDPVYGVIGFLANMLREEIHILIYPLLSRCCPLEAITIGGATTMDTGLPVVALYGERKHMLVALIQGGIITLIAPIILPLMLGD